MQFTDIKNGNGKVVGFKISTQFELKSPERLIEADGPKELSWKYEASQGTSPETVERHVGNVKAHVNKNWRKLKTNIKSEAIKSLKPLEELYKKKSEQSRKDESAGFKRIASNKIEGIILTEWSKTANEASKTSIAALGQKNSKLKAAAGKVAIGTAVVGVSVAGIAASIVSFGAATLPALAGTAIAISALSASGTLYKTYKASRKEFRAAQDKLAKSKAAALKAMDTCMTDATNLQKKADKMALQVEEMGKQIAELRTQADKCSSVLAKGKLLQKVGKLRDDLTEDKNKLQKLLADYNPQELIDGIEASIKSLKDDVKIDEHRTAHGRMETAFSVVGNASNLATAVGGLAAP